MSLWWENFINSIVVEEKEWKENFRMPRANFFNLAGLLRPYIEKQVTAMRDPVSV